MTAAVAGFDGSVGAALLHPQLTNVVMPVRTNSEYRQLRQALGGRAEPMISLHDFGTGGFAHGIKHRWAGEPS